MEGPVFHCAGGITNSRQDWRLQYVVIFEERYQALIAAEQEAYYGRIKASLKEVKAGKAKKSTTVDDLLKGIEAGEGR